MESNSQNYNRRPLFSEIRKKDLTYEAMKNNVLETHLTLRKKKLENILMEKRRINTLSPNDDLSQYNLLKLLPIETSVSILKNERTDYTTVIQSLFSLVKLSDREVGKINAAIIESNLHVNLFKVLEDFSNKDESELKQEDVMIVSQLLLLFGNLFTLVNNPLFVFFTQNKFLDTICNFLNYQNRSVPFNAIFTLNSYILEDENYAIYLVQNGIIEKVIKIAKMKSNQDKNILDCLAFLMNLIKATQVEHVEKIFSSFQFLSTLLNHSNELIVQITIKILSDVTKRFNIGEKLMAFSILDNIDNVLNKLFRSQNKFFLIPDTINILVNLSIDNSTANAILSSNVFMNLTFFFCNDNSNQNHKINTQIIENTSKLYLRSFASNLFVDFLKENSILVNRLAQYIGVISQFETHILLSVFYALLSKAPYENFKSLYETVLIFKLIEVIQSDDSVKNLTISACLIIKIIKLSSKSIKQILSNCGLCDVVSNFIVNNKKIDSDSNLRQAFTALEKILLKLPFEE